MSHNDKSPGDLDQILDGMIRHPKRTAMLFLMLASAYFSMIALAMAGIITLLFLCFRGIRGWWWILAIEGTLLLFLSWWVLGMTIHYVHQRNALFFSYWIHSVALTPDFFDYLVAFPYSLILSASFIALGQWPSTGLSQEVKRIKQGQLSSPEPIITEKKQHRALLTLTQCAYTEGSILGVNQYTGEMVTLSDKEANLHTLAIGTTGSGKTTGLGNIIESAIIRGCPLFYIDGKGDSELADRIAAFVKEQGRPFYLFSMIGDSVKYNPLSCGGFTSKKDRIIELREWSDDHYRKLAEGYLQTVLKILEELSIPLDLYQLAQYLEPKTLYHLARSHEGVGLIEIIESLEESRPSITSLIAEIHNMTNSEIGHLFDCSEGKVLKLEQALQEKAVVYFCLQPLAFPTYAQLLGKLIINDLKSLLATQLTQPKKPVIYTIFDEFSVFAGDPIIHLINQGRSAGVHAVLSTQSLSDISRAGGDAFLGQVLNNVNNYIIQRQNNPEDAERLAHIIGTQDNFEITSQISDSSPFTVGSVRRVKEFIIHPDQIKRLQQGEAILLNKSCFQVQLIRLRKGPI